MAVTEISGKLSRLHLILSSSDTLRKCMNVLILKISAIRCCDISSKKSGAELAQPPFQYLNLDRPAISPVHGHFGIPHVAHTHGPDLSSLLHSLHIRRAGWLPQACRILCLPSYPNALPFDFYPTEKLFCALLNLAFASLCVLVPAIRCSS